ncbi:hypothetical protein [Nocardioides sp. SYSU DS0663]|uniref:hypothetical protein n=1 Tax=Nocardioides sp. SYSU DS0663 TaxID=3416445 RepID=UPI003F4B2F3D
MATLTIPSRFCGPPGSANGGWSAGALAALLSPRTAAEAVEAVEVRLRRPPPLERSMPVEERDGWTVATDEGEVVLQARPAATGPDPLAAVPLEEARAAEAAYAGHRAHPFPGCFSCGTGREPGDGLRIFPGPAGPGRVAATWTPGPDDATAPVAWAALDCAGAWAAGVDERPMVLGSMTARLWRLPEPGAPHVVVGAHRRTDGRRQHTATTLHVRDQLVGASEQVWFTVDPADFAGPAPG